MALVNKKENNVPTPENSVEETVENNRTFFPSLECSYEENIFENLPANAERMVLSELSPDDEFMGKPLLSEIQTVTFDDDGEEVTKYRCQLIILDDDEEEPEYLIINLNLKANDDIQTNIRKGSVLYDFIASIRELEQPGIMSHYNKINRVNLKEFRDFINDVGVASVKVLGRTLGNGAMYNSFKFTELKNE